MMVIIIFTTSCGLAKGKYYIPSNYINAEGKFNSITRNHKNEIIEYGIQITYTCDVKLNYLNYCCKVYNDGKLLETIKKEVKNNSLYERYIPIATKYEFDRLEVEITGYSDEKPQNYNDSENKNNNYIYVTIGIILIIAVIIILKTIKKNSNNAPETDNEFKTEIETETIDKNKETVTKQIEEKTEIEKRLEQLKNLKEKELITEEDYREKIKRILDEI